MSELSFKTGPFETQLLITSTYEYRYVMIMMILFDDGDDDDEDDDDDDDDGDGLSDVSAEQLQALCKTAPCAYLIFVFFSPQAPIFGLTFLHTKARKSRQNRFRDKTA